MIRRITQVQIESHDVVSVTKIKGRLESTPDPTINGVMQDKNILPRPGKSFRLLSSTVGAAVVDDDQLPAILVF